MRNRISENLKAAMKDKNPRRTGTLRLINAAITDRDIALRGSCRNNYPPRKPKPLLPK